MFPAEITNNRWIPPFKPDENWSISADHDEGCPPSRSGADVTANE
ncbi:hypothetical protein BAZMOX_29650_0 [methanotrophic endosymbiont of Bathymodiolus azoricus (Menez Gwen)]|nr:hypothetical protein BAZMOX_29650_0 [methanotrophic endosymbiont of Bathymodiolus azoricus (Menez Gwen)]